MMDTDALWQAIAAYGNARWRGVKFEQDAADHLSEIKEILNRAEAETRELMATNERLVDEVGSLKAARIAYASEFPPIPDGDDAGLPAVDRIHENIRRLKAENAELKAKLTEKASLLRGCYAADHKQKQRIEELTAELERIKALEPVAWEVYVADADNAYVVESLDDPQLIDDCTNSDAVVTPLIALGSKTA